MESACVRLTELPHTSKLFADFVYHFERVAPFYTHSPFAPGSYAAAASEVDYPASRRRDLVSALRKQNQPSPALELLADPATKVVVTGQQVGLYSGPAYTIYKALTAAKLARALSESGIPTVPVFWLATQDHDFAEVNHCWVFGADHQPVRVEARGAADNVPRPVGGIPVDRSALTSLREAIAPLPFGDDVARSVEEAYAAGQTFGSAFRNLLERILSPYGLVFLDPLDPAIQPISAPLLRDAVIRAAELQQALLQRDAELAAAGYHSQVHLEKHTSLVFLLEEGRRLVLRRNESGYAVNGRTLSSEELAGRAEQLSPNALLRPVVQDYILPTVAYVGGPAELAYLAQSEVIYRMLLGRMPVATPRQAFTLLDSRSKRLFEKYDLSLQDFFGGEDSLREKISNKLVPPGVSQALSRTSASVTAPLNELDSVLKSFDSTLAAALAKSRAKIEYQISKIGRKVAREALRRDGQAQRDSARLNALVFPHRHLQERFYSIIPFLAEHGPGLLDRIYENTYPDCPDHHVLAV